MEKLSSLLGEDAVLKVPSEEAQKVFGKLINAEVEIDTFICLAEGGSNLILDAFTASMWGKVGAKLNERAKEFYPRRLNSSLDEIHKINEMFWRAVK